MDHSDIDVLIVDDEQFAREGFKNIIDWEALGFHVCGEAADGEEALEKIRLYRPGLTLLDVKLPGMLGLEVLKAARAFGYAGEVIILSGYTDFAYAQKAIGAGVLGYLVKPVDEAELLSLVRQAKERILRGRLERAQIDEYFSQSKEKVLAALVTGEGYSPLVNYAQLGFSKPPYQVVIYEGFRAMRKRVDFAELLFGLEEKRGVEEMRIDGRDVLLLVGPGAVERFAAWNRRLLAGQMEPGSYLDSVFFVCGERVETLKDIEKSYRQCRRLIERRFYCAADQHMLSPADIKDREAVTEKDETLAMRFSGELCTAAQQQRKGEAKQALRELREYFAGHDYGNMRVKHIMIDILLRIKQHFLRSGGEAVRTLLPSNTELIERVESFDYFYEIEDTVLDILTRLMDTVGGTGPEQIIEEVLRYMRENYGGRLTLEGIAPRFGYNSAYLGKLFAARTGMGFNACLEQIRIEKAKELLSTTQEQVQNIAARVGYRYIDVFNQKFRKLTGCSPSEYRKRYAGLQ